MKELSRKLVGLIPQVGGKYNYLQLNEEVTYDDGEEIFRRVESKILYVSHHEFASMTAEQRSVFNAFAALYPMMEQLSKNTYPG